MEEKDYIYIYDKNGKKTKMELILAMNSLDGKFQYIAYKQEDKVVPLYMAKLYLKRGISDLDTNLSQEEIEMLKKVIKEKVVGGINE